MTSTLRDCLLQAKQQLTTDSASLDAQILLAHILGKDRTWILAHDDELMAQDDRARFFRQIEKRQAGYPVAYILGYQEFWSLRFAVNEATLIPRPDTEILVEEVLKAHPGTPSALLDLGTGSGAIAISLAIERPKDHVFAVDYSQNAAAVANNNKLAHDAKNVSFIVSDWSSSIAPKSIDIVVSNPPYIAETDEHLAALEYEPVSALASGADGLRDIVKIAQDAVRCLKTGGILALEHGYNQQPEVINILKQFGFSDIQTTKDLAGQPRVVTAKAP